MTPRKAAVLAMNLPAGARVWASCGFDSAWSAETHMLTNTVDVLLGANWQRSGGKGLKPAPITRPGDESRAKGRAALAMSKAAKFKARQQQNLQLVDPVPET